MDFHGQQYKPPSYRNKVVCATDFSTGFPIDPIDHVVQLMVTCVVAQRLHMGGVTLMKAFYGNSYDEEGMFGKV